MSIYSCREGGLTMSSIAISRLILVSSKKDHSTQLYIHPYRNENMNEISLARCSSVWWLISLRPVYTIEPLGASGTHFLPLHVCDWSSSCTNMVRTIRPDNVNERRILHINFISFYHIRLLLWSLGYHCYYFTGRSYRSDSSFGL